MGGFSFLTKQNSFATLSLLGEANSRFGSDADALSLFGVKWALFPSLQLGWVMTNEGLCSTTSQSSAR